MTPRFFLLPAFLLCTLISSAQLSGILLNEKSREPVPFANIVIDGAETGTTSDLNGHFYLETFSAGNTITVLVSGYENKQFSGPVSPENIILLKEKVIRFPEVMKSDAKGTEHTTLNPLPEKKIKSFYPAPQYPRILARYFENDKKHGSTPWMEEVKLLTKSERKNVSFALHLYEVGIDGAPGNEIVKAYKIIEVPKGEETMVINLRDLYIRFPKDGIYIGVEWLFLPENEFTEISKDRKSKSKTKVVTHEPQFANVLRTYEPFTTWTFQNGRWKSDTFRVTIARPDFYDLAMELQLGN